MPLHFEITDEKFVTLNTVKKVLGKRKKSEMTYEQKMAYENAKNFSKLSDKNVNALHEELMNLEMRKLTDKLIIKIIDIVPETIDDLKVIFKLSKISFKKNELDNVFEIVKKYVK